MIEAASVTLARKQRLHRRAVRLEYFTVSWNVLEALAAITAGVIAGSVALIGFGVDSGIEVLSAMALLWRLRRVGGDADAEQEQHAERRALYAVAVTYFLLAAYIGYEARWRAETNPMRRPSDPCCRWSRLSSCRRSPTGSSGQAAMGSRALQADAVETWVCSTSRSHS